jgi:hypothetical protein
MKVLRNELKYYIKYTDYKLLSKLLKSLLSTDKHSMVGDGYTVRSLYFDTFYDKAFYEKVYGVGKRKKYRLRIYSNKDQNVKFEIKNKIKDMIYKETAIIKKEDALKVINGNYSCLLKYNDEILNKIYCDFKKEPFRPIVIIDYLREAYIYDLNKIRITFDHELSREDSELDLFKTPITPKNLLREGLVVLEVKFNNYLPQWLCKALETIPTTRSAISKYCLGRIGGADLHLKT